MESSLILGLAGTALVFLLALIGSGVPTALARRAERRRTSTNTYESLVDGPNAPAPEDAEDPGGLRKSPVLKLLHGFGAGAVVAVALVHALPEAFAKVGEIAHGSDSHAGTAHSHSHGFPWAGVAALAGALVGFAADEMVAALLAAQGGDVCADQPDSHTAAEAATARLAARRRQRDLDSGAGPVSSAALCDDMDACLDGEGDLPGAGAMPGASVAGPVCQPVPPAILAVTKRVDSPRPAAARGPTGPGMHHIPHHHHGGILTHTHFHEPPATVSELLAASDSFASSGHRLRRSVSDTSIRCSADGPSATENRPLFDGPATHLSGVYPPTPPGQAGLLSGDSSTPSSASSGGSYGSISQHHLSSRSQSPQLSSSSREDTLSAKQASSVAFEAYVEDHGHGHGHSHGGHGHSHGGHGHSHGGHGHSHNAPLSRFSTMADKIGYHEQLHAVVDAAAEARMLRRRAAAAQLTVLFTGLALHSLVIGIAFGVSSGAGSLEAGLLAALAAHQLFEGLALGSRIVRAGLHAPESRVDRIKAALMHSGFALSVPAGIGIGIGLAYWPNLSATTLDLVSAGFQAAAGGLLIYVGWVHLVREELAQPEFCDSHAGTRLRLWLYAGMFLGSAAMTALGAWV
ncbi:hypothetical protein H696_01849 [Fonticula alba]|uniref:Uncharacterized protein n=1 Tax=Fonticula alba TaxID=691883 RepID=A0A058ZBU8_FONAL|nr:hypothetical protein H696_01849 [Fonticula alba]KCV70902.1 hypothetical protein H696_01849 [Fonticula alba]|eukprot:XP_009494025.1 hypothetical protein H696_01849 [Fonticula alba]